jgi:hypothetical protein
MSSNLPERDEPLLPDRELAPGDWRLPVARPEFRSALANETARLVRRRARRRRWARAGQFALAYAAGVLTVIGVWQAAAGRDRAENAVAVRPPAPHVSRPEAPPPANTQAPAVAAAPPKTQPPQAAAVDERRLSPAQLRARVAGAPRDEQIRLLRLAGDRYLYDYEDLAAALHCYRQVLELDPPNQRRPFEPDDSWLLAELKNARVLQSRPQSPPEA